MVAIFIRPGNFDTFEPDILVEDQQSLTSYGVDATVIHLPGHTEGSIGILTADKDLFCGDLMDSKGKPSLEFYIDDLVAARASLNKLRDLRARPHLPPGTASRSGSTRSQRTGDTARPDPTPRRLRSLGPFQRICAQRHDEDMVSYGGPRGLSPSVEPAHLDQGR